MTAENVISRINLLSNKIHRLWFDGYDWYIADSADEAQKLQIDLTGRDLDRDATNEFTEVDLDLELTLVPDESNSNGVPIKETRKVRDWLHGRTKGFLASTEE